MGFEWTEDESFNADGIIKLKEEQKKLITMMQHMKNTTAAQPKFDWHTDELVPFKQYNHKPLIVSRHMHNVITSWSQDYPQTPQEAVATPPGFHWEGELPERPDVMKSKLKQRHAERLARALGIKPWDTRRK